MDGNLLSLVPAGAVMALAGAIVYKLNWLPKFLFDKIKRNLIFTVHIYQYDELFDIVEAWLAENYQSHYKDVEATISYSDSLYSNAPTGPSTPGPVKDVRFKQEESFFVIKWKGKKIIVKKAKQTLDKAVSLRELFHRHYQISSIGGKAAIMNLLSHIVDTFNSRNMQDFVNVYMCNEWGEWQQINELRPKTFENIVLPAELKYFIISDLERFRDGFKWYKERGIAYKRGYCFHGDPGNGKSSIATAMALMMRRQIYFLNLNSFEKDVYMMKAFQTMKNNSIVLIEDIDTMFDGNTSLRGKITFSCLLNCIDGVASRGGSITIITTNHFNKLDPALIRAGRMDVIKEIPNPSDDLVVDYVRGFFSDNNISFSPELQNKISMSKIQEVCISNKEDAAAALKAIALLKL